MLAALLAALLLGSPPSASPEVIVGGWVVHARTGARLPGARVSMHCGSRLPMTTRWTDLDGAFVFRGLTAGSCRLFASLGTGMPRLALTLHAGERRLLDIPLDPEAKTGDYQFLQAMQAKDPYITKAKIEVPRDAEVILGGLAVHHQTGEPLAGALLILRCAGTTREQTSAADGTFVFLATTPGECTLQALAGTANRTTELVLAAGERRLVDVSLDPERRLTADPAFAEQARRTGDTVQVPLHR